MRVLVRGGGERSEATIVTLSLHYCILLTTISVHGWSPIATPPKPTPNHTDAGPVRLMVARSLVASSVTDTLTRLADAASSTAPLASAPAPHCVVEVGSLLKKVWMVRGDVWLTMLAEQPKGRLASALVVLMKEWPPKPSVEAAT